MNWKLKNGLFLGCAISCLGLKSVLANPYNLDKIPLGYWQYYERSFKTPVVYFRIGNNMDGRMGNTCFSAQIGSDRVQVNWSGEVPKSLSNNYSINAFTADNINFQEISQKYYQQAMGYCKSSRQTYQNQKFGFNFTYPSNYILEERNNNLSLKSLILWDKKDYQALQSGFYEQTDGPLRDISIVVYPNANLLSPLEWAKNNNNYSNFSSPLRKDNYRNIDFAGQAGISYTWCGLACGDNIIFTSRDKRYIFTLTVVYGDRLDLIKQDFQYIISTFKLSNSWD